MNINTIINKIEKLFEDNNYFGKLPKVLKSFINSIHLNDIQYKKLLNTKDHKILFTLSLKDELPLFVINSLVNYGDSFIELNISEAKYKLPENILLKLVKSSNIHIKKNVIDRNDLTEKIIKILAFDKNYKVREYLYDTKSEIPFYIIILLCCDKNPTVTYIFQELIFGLPYEKITKESLEKSYDLIRTKKSKNTSIEEAIDVFDYLSGKLYFDDKKLSELSSMFKTILLHAM